MLVDEIRSFVLSAAIGFMAVALVGSQLGLDSGAVAAGTVFATVLVYLVWCRVFRTRVCPRCKGKREWTDGHGHQRERNCRRCGATGRERRLGAVLQGLSKRG